MIHAYLLSPFNLFSHPLHFSEEATSLAKEVGVELKGYVFTARKEDLRRPRIVRVGLIQNSVDIPTTAPIHVQRDALHEKVSNILRVASAAGVNVICFQEAWSRLDVLMERRIVDNLGRIFSYAVRVLHSGEIPMVRVCRGCREWSNDQIDEGTGQTVQHGDHLADPGAGSQSQRHPVEHGGGDFQQRKLHGKAP